MSRQGAASTARRSFDVAAALCVAATLLLGALWLADRTRRWEVPSWRSERFVPLRAGSDAAGGGGALRVVPVNPRCGRCREVLARLHALGSSRPRGGRLLALIVDTPRRPDPASLGTLPLLETWWDRDGIWRRRWGHRLYGEVLEFDTSGRFVRTLPADALLPRGRSPDVMRHHAPVVRGEGET